MLGGPVFFGEGQTRAPLSSWSGNSDPNDISERHLRSTPPKDASERHGGKFDSCTTTPDPTPSMAGDPTHRVCLRALRLVHSAGTRPRSLHDFH